MKYLNLVLISLVLYLLSCTSDKAKQLASVKSVLYDKASTYNDKGNLDSAFIYFSRAKDAFIQNKDSLGVAKCLVHMAFICTEKGDYFGGQEFSLSSISYLSKSNKDHQAYFVSNFNNLGVTSSYLENYPQAISFYKQSLIYTKDTASLVIIENNIAYAYSEKGDYKSAITLYDNILNRGIKDINYYTKVLSNRASAKWLQNPTYKAATPLLKALQIRLAENDLPGIHSSYAYLSDYYANRKVDSALFYALRMYSVAQKINNTDDRLIALQRIIKLSKPEDTKRYFLSYQLLNDSTQTARNLSKHQFAVVRYETEKYKADFLKAQTENVAKQKNILIKNIGIAVLVASLILGFFWYRRRQKLMRQEKEIEVKNTEIKYVKKVHDHVANRIYQVIDELDNNPQIDKNEVAEKLDIIYHISRDLSYENMVTQHHQSFDKALSKMFFSYQSPTVAIHLTGNEEKLWHNLSETVKAEIYAILQELMTNMSKHSMANLVEIKFILNHKQLTISYSDNGKGIKNFSFGNGLRNTETRIKSIAGLITFDTEPNQGLKVKISFPI